MVDVFFFPQSCTFFFSSSSTSNCTRLEIPCQLFHSIDEAFERLNEIMMMMMKRILHNLCPLQLILSFFFVRSERFEI